MANSGRDLSQQIIDGRYRVEYRLGRGGMGSVWSVQHVESLKRFALKTLESDLATNPSARDRLLREARAAATLRSRHVVQVVDARTGYVHDGQPLPFLVMERLDGLTLEQWLTTRGVLKPGHVLWLMRQVGRALSEAHEHGIVHRDLKPSNVFLTVDEDGAPLVKLCDFGIAKLTASAAAMLLNSTGARTSTGDILGTPLYLAPELLRSAAHATPATDQWALGLTVYRALTGREYFDGISSGPDLVLRIAQDPLPAPTALGARVPAPFDAWFLRSCARVPEHRFDSVAAQMQQLETALTPAEPEAIPIGTAELADTASAPANRVLGESAPVSLDPPPKRPRARLGLVFAMAWALAGSAWLLWKSPPETVSSSTVPGDRSAGNSAPEAPATSARSAAATMTDDSADSPEEAQPSRSPTGPDPSLSSAAAAKSAVPAKPVARPTATPTVTRSSSPATAPKTVRARSVPVRAAASGPAEVESKATPTEPPSPTPHKLGVGQPCRRSSECESGLCLAEECR